MCMYISYVTYVGMIIRENIVKRGEVGTERKETIQCLGHCEAQGFLSRKYYKIEEMKNVKIKDKYRTRIYFISFVYFIFFF